MAIAEDRRRLTHASRCCGCRLASPLAMLACGFWFFQVVQHAQFKEMAENNHQRTLTLRAPRGIIYDRTGKLLVENRNSFNISIVREHTKDLGSHDPRAVARRSASTRKSCARSSIGIAASRAIARSSSLQDATLAQVAAVTARRLDFELPDVHRAGSADAPVSWIRTWPRT